MGLRRHLYDNLCTAGLLCDLRSEEGGSPGAPPAPAPPLPPRPEHLRLLLAGAVDDVIAQPKTSADARYYIIGTKPALDRTHKHTHTNTRTHSGGVGGGN